MYMRIRMCVYVCEFNNHIGISPTLSIDESDITEDSATLICELSCFSPNSRCVVSLLTTNNMGANVVCAIGQVTGSVMAYSYPTQTITLNCLNSDTTYNYYVIATNATDMGQVGEPLCGSFTTRIIRLVYTTKIMRIKCALMRIDRVHMECALNGFAFNAN